MKNKKQLV